MGLGSYPEVPLDKDQRDDGSPDGARQIAAKWRNVKAGGKDPIEVREAERASGALQAARSISFRQCAEFYIAAHQASWKNAKHAAQWGSTLRAYAYPEFGELPVSVVDVTLVHKVLEPIWGKKTETARRLRGRIEAVLDWAKAREYRQGENPARWKGGLESLFPKHSKVRRVQHHPALPYAELPTFIAGIQAQEGIGAVALQFVILTAARTGEAINAKWNEVDFDKAIWSVPGVRMKSGREHRVPLSKPAQALLRERYKATGGKGFIFPGERAKKPISNMAMLMLLQRMDRDDLTVHGFRSTFRDWVEETTNYAGTVAEAALAHVVGDKVEAA
jgi:integrase